MLTNVTILALAIIALRVPAIGPPQAGTTPGSAVHEQATDPGSQLFAGEVPRLSFTVAAEDVARLIADPRTYVPAAMQDGGAPLTVAIRLKGAAGSFRPFDDRPSLTVNVDRIDPDARFRGLRKFHLNNSVQDDSYLNELLGSEAFRTAGIPTPRVTHARVVLNGRDCGLYVLKESFDRPFLRQHFASPDGNLYDSGLQNDVDAELERDSGTGAGDRSDLRAIVEACQDEDFGRGVRRLESLFDMEELVTFMAVERLLGHWDGYTDGANNYRLYFDPATSKAVLLPHGMDQILGDPAAPLFEDATTLLAATVLRSDRWSARYGQRLEQLASVVIDPARMEATIDAASARLASPLASCGPDAVAHHAEMVPDLKRRIRLRAAFVSHHSQDRQPGARRSPLPLEGQAVHPVSAWAAFRESDHMRLEAAESGDGPGRCTEYRIIASGAEPAESAWRTTIPLRHGRYLLRVEVRTADLVSPPDEPGVGALLVTAAGNAEHELSGTTEWTVVTAPLVIREDWRPVECAIRLRAVRGTVAFRHATIEPAPEGN